MLCSCREQLVHQAAPARQLAAIDKVPADDPTVFPAAPGVAPDAPALIGWAGRAFRPAASPFRPGRCGRPHLRLRGYIAPRCQGDPREDTGRTRRRRSRL